jgi:hypothetical protein
MNKKEIKAWVDKLMKHIDRAIAKGGTFNRMWVCVDQNGKLDEHDPQICLLGAVIVGHKYDGADYHRTAANILKIGYKDAVNIERGLFHAEYTIGENDTDFFKIGYLVGKRLIKRGIYRPS